MALCPPWRPDFAGEKAQSPAAPATCRDVLCGAAAWRKEDALVAPTVREPCFWRLRSCNRLAPIRAVFGALSLSKNG